jgi:hypothetical protein
MLAGHYSFAILALAAVLLLADDLTGEHYTALSGTRTGVWTVWFITSALIDRKFHLSRLCDRCAAGTPLDPQASVERWIRFLRLDHAVGRTLLLALAFLALVWWGERQHTWLSAAVDIMFVLWLVALSTAEYMHRKLYPWCPYCHWDDGGDHEEAPDVPAPVVEA